MMGMGEPLYNFDNVKAALGTVMDGDALALSKRRVTLSTAGVVPMIARAGNEIGSSLAISLHAVRDEIRDVIVPINKKYPIAELLEACRTYPGASNARRITFEYVMLKGVNDSIADARELVKLVAGIPAKINLIPFNAWPGAPYECSDWSQIEKFAEIVNRAGYASPVRTPRGRDDHGGLRPAQERKRQGTRRRPHGGRPVGPDRPHAALMGRILVIAGIVLVVAGLAWPFLSRLGLGNLPGDIVIRGEQGGFYFPIVTCIVISLVLSLIFWLARQALAGVDFGP